MSRASTEAAIRYVPLRSSMAPLLWLEDEPQRLGFAQQNGHLVLRVVVDPVRGESALPRAARSHGTGHLARLAAEDLIDLEDDDRGPGRVREERLRMLAQELLACLWRVLLPCPVPFQVYGGIRCPFPFRALLEIASIGLGGVRGAEEREQSCREQPAEGIRASSISISSADPRYARRSPRRGLSHQAPRRSLHITRWAGPS